MSYTIPQGKDARTKLTDEDRETIRHRYSNPLDNTSMRQLAREFGVDRRLISFIVDPEKHRQNLARRKERMQLAGGYYTEKSAEYARRHRARLAELNPEGKAEHLAQRRAARAAKKEAGNV